MVSWDKHDINDPELYKPRPKALVKKASDQGLLAEKNSRPSPTQHKGYVLVPENEPLEAPDDFVYDDDLYWGKPLQEVAPESQPGRPSAPKAAAPSVRYGGNADTARMTPKSPVRAGAAKAKQPRRASGKTSSRIRPYLYVGVITACLLILAAMGIMMMPQLAGYFWRDMDNFAFINGELLRYDATAAQTYRQYRDYMRQDVIYPGIFVDGLHIGGMTKEEARQAIAETDIGAQNLYSVTVAIGNKEWVIDNTNVPASRDPGNVVERAYAIGRTNTTTILGTKQTPFRERTAAAIELREEGVNLMMAAQFDQEALRSVVDEIARFVTREPKNAEVASFDFNTRAFSFVDEQIGTGLDSDALYEKLAESLDKREQGARITVTPLVEQPAITREQLAKNFKMVSAYTTDTTSEKSRNNNINLAAQAINGTVLLPGDVFSFNKTTGQRTIAKGYQEAGAIAGGQSIEEVGGGICQISSTLFNAVVRANLEVVSRSPHAWPSTYVNRGEDATVNWPNLDFQFKNNTNAPIFVITYFKDRKCSAEIWGLSLGEGIHIDLHSEVMQTLNPPNEVKYVNNPNLPFGTSKETIKARTGYVVDTYQVWYQNGSEFRREKLHTTTYRAYQRTMEYN